MKKIIIPLSLIGLCFTAVSFTFGGPDNDPVTPAVVNTTSLPFMAQEHTAVVNMLASLNTGQLNTARAATNLNGLVLGPNQSGNFPTNRIGVAVSSLSDAQKTLIMEAIKPWLNTLDASTAADMLNVYESELDETYIAYTGNGRAGNIASFRNASTQYVRIDGPSIWIEFVCQLSPTSSTGVVYQTIWRDHSRDLGNYQSATNLEGTAETGINEVVRNSSTIFLYPNPAQSVLNISLSDQLNRATVEVLDLNGRRMVQLKNQSGNSLSLDVGAYPAGFYSLRIMNNGTLSTKKFVKQ